MRNQYIRQKDEANRIEYLKPSATARILDELAAWLEEIRWRWGQPHKFSNEKYWKFVHDVSKDVLHELDRRKALKEMWE